MLIRATFMAALAIATAMMAMTGSAEAKTYPHPAISSFSPTSGGPGTVITVVGSGFTGVDAAWIGRSHDAKVDVLSDGKVQVTVPKDATSANLGLLNPVSAVFAPVAFHVTAPTTGQTKPSGPVAVGGRTFNVPGVSVQLTGASMRLATTDAAGRYEFTGVSAGRYTVAPSHPAYIFSPASRAEDVSDAPVGDAVFWAAPNSAPTYGITGTVSGAVAAGVAVTLTGTNYGAAVTDAAGNWGFFGLKSGTYRVTAHKEGYALSASQWITVGTVDSVGHEFTSALPVGTENPVLALKASLPKGRVGTPYSQSVQQSVSGGKGPYHYQSASVVYWPPPGLTLDPAGKLSGTPTEVGTYEFPVSAVDANGNVSNVERIKVTVAPAAVVVTPPPPNTSWVYYDGKFDWPGDYSFVATPDYQDTSGEPLSGPYDIKVTLNGSWGGWLPYALNWTFNSSPYTKLTFALKPTVENQKWNVYFVKIHDVPIGIYVDPSNYGPAPEVGKWGVYTIPLKDLGVEGQPIYKFCFHDETGLSDNVWYVDNVGFVE